MLRFLRAIELIWSRLEDVNDSTHSKSRKIRPRAASPAAPATQEIIGRAKQQQRQTPTHACVTHNYWCTRVRCAATKKCFAALDTVTWSPYRHVFFITTHSCFESTHTLAMCPFPRGSLSFTHTSAFLPPPLTTTHVVFYAEERRALTYVSPPRDKQTLASVSKGSQML